MIILLIQISDCTQYIFQIPNVYIYLWEKTKEQVILCAAFLS